MYVCIKKCFIESLFHVGDVVDADTASLAPKCFEKLQSRTKEKMEQEIEEKIPEIATRKNANKPISARDLLKSRNKVKIAGE